MKNKECKYCLQIDVDQICYREPQVGKYIFNMLLVGTNHDPLRTSAGCVGVLVLTADWRLPEEKVGVWVSLAVSPPLKHKNMVGSVNDICFGETTH